ncbi:glycosyltransferase family 2 protein [Novosphingobium sp. 9]|uniref:glycosyltransferase family 2 protein n=1 Tax=Novosphingobium sp. 9 TaxID=2025349 RepID=UPI0021B6BE53|nr:glycosyltransferase [Novosphingobium sp. 9]
MSISVLTIVRNRAGHLAQLIEGLRRSEAFPDELIIVDMASESPVQVDDLPFSCRTVRLACKGLPLAEARNKAASVAAGDQLLFLDVDCIPMRGLVSAIAKVLVDHDALVCAQVRYLGPNDARSQWDETALLAHAHGHPARSFPSNGLQQIDNPGLFWSLVFGIRRERFRNLGGFDESFSGYGAEDTDFGFRAKNDGLPLLFMGGAGAFHQHHASSDPPLQHFEDIVRNAHIFHKKWGVWPMEGWLAAFADAGFVIWNKDMLAIERYPSNAEIIAANVA